MAISRRQFLRSDFRGQHAELRPPWAGSDFVERCTGCGDCVAACPAQLLSIEHRYATIDFRRGECDFCEACHKACKKSALRPSGEPWPYRARVQGACLALNQIHCRTCEDQCEAEAIRFPPVAHRVAHPKVDDQLCTGCGACVAPCPVSAMVIESQTQRAEEVCA